MVINLPNQITIARLILAIGFFGLMSMTQAEQFAAQRSLLAACFWVFLVAALSDVLDGALARRTGQITSFGRIVDPVVDKVLVCGAFLFLASHHFYDPTRKLNLSGVEPWIVVLILSREMLVSAVRSYSESHGQPYPADWLGKLKMFVQCTTVCVVLGQLAWFYDSGAFTWLARTCVWTTAAVTALSLVTYVQRGRAFLFSRAALSNAPLSTAASMARGDPSPRPGSGPMRTSGASA